MKASFILGTLAILALSFSGCTGKFDIKQTEPFRIEVNGDGFDSRVASSNSGSSEPERVECIIEKEENVEVVTVIVKVKKVEVVTESPSPTTATNTTDDDAERVIVLIIVKDEDTDEKLAEQQVEADDQDANVNLNVNVKGHNNLVVVTQAVQGVADVNVSAEGSTSTDGGSTTGAPMPTSPAPTTTYA
jgi:hypothetical protein